jgi:flagellar biosynthesis/type III secretory pathway chaperone
MSVQRAEVYQHLDHILAEEERLLVELEQLLQQETASLQADDLPEIQRIGSERYRCIGRLTQLDAERLDSCRMLSFGGDRGALEKLFQWADPSARLQSRWRANLEIARRCKEHNDRNGAIVSVKLGRVQRLLAKLRGAPSAPVYGRRGGRDSQLAARDLGRA